MFLNEFGQPLILDPNKNYGPYEQHNGPMLITAVAFKDSIKSTACMDSIIGSEEDVLQLKSTFPNVYTNHLDYCGLRPNETTEIQCCNNKIKVTLLPSATDFAEESARRPRMFYVENGYTRTIIVDDIPATLDFIPKSNASFHNGLKKGIDVMYLVDPLQESENEDTYALVQVIRPKHIYGVRQDNLPKWLLDLCVRRDLYTHEFS